jgi:DNA-binding CsgD family transcriptional regulator
MLVGRAGECARVDALVEAARQGRSGTLVVRGEAGVGKTALLRYAAERADGMRVLETSGIESESELPFSGLSDLFRLVLDRIDALPVTQAAALRGALALGPPAAADRFAVYAATLGLLAEAADDTPLLALVDDAHWLDRESAEALLFATRRLDAEGVAVVFAAREGFGEARFEAPGLEELSVTGLDLDSAKALLAAHASRPPAPHVAARLVEDTAGNPLALLELAALLTEDELSGRTALAEPAPVGASVERAFLRQAASLGDQARRALLVAATGALAELGPILEAAAALGLDASAFEEAEEAGLIAVDGSWIVFRHPLFRSAVYSAASPPERRGVHRALAEALTGEGNSDLRAWHLAAGALGTDDEAADALEQAAEHARARSGYAAAAAALEHAARLSLDQEVRTRRLLAAADAALRAGRRGQARLLLDDARAGSPAAALSAEIEHARGQVELFSGRAAAAYELFREAAARIETTDPDRAATMLAEASLGAYLAGRTADSVLAAERARELTRTTGGNAELVSELVLGAGLYVAGEVQEGFRRLALSADIAEGRRGVRPDAEYVLFAVVALVLASEYGRARSLVHGAVDEARAAGALGVLPFALYASSLLDIRTGRFTTAYASASEAARLAADTDAPLWRCFALGSLALVEAVRGDEEACRRHAGEALELGAALDLEYPRDAHDALGLLELALGRPEEAIAHLERANRLPGDPTGPPVLARFSAPDLVEAYVRAGRPLEEHMFAQLVTQSGQTEFLAIAALAWRCRGLLAGERALDGSFGEALRLHRELDMPFALARTMLCYGERLRRLGRRDEARDQLRAAHATFERLGAAPWAGRVESELLASGETLPRRGPTAAERLTPQELQIALVVSTGATNREAGAALFLSPRTIEVHLGRVYRKLGIRSRTELARLLTDEADAVEAEQSA